MLVGAVGRLQLRRSNGVSARGAACRSFVMSGFIVCARLVDGIRQPTFGCKISTIKRVGTGHTPVICLAATTHADCDFAHVPALYSTASHSPPPPLRVPSSPRPTLAAVYPTNAATFVPFTSRRADPARLASIGQDPVAGEPLSPA